MSYIPPSGRFNATISGNTAGVGSLVSAGTLSLAGGNNITLSQNGNGITISGANAPSGSINFSAGTTSGNLASLTFSNSNGIGFGLNGGVITASHNGLTSQSNQALSASNGSFAFQTAAFSNANGVTFGTSAGSIMTASVNTSYAASNHSHGNPTLALTNISGATASNSGGLTLSLSAAAPGGGGVALSGAGGSITSGTASISAGGALSASFNGQTLSLNAPIQSNLSATGAVSISNNGNTISIGAPIQTNQTMGFYAAGNTTQNSSTTFDARSLTFNGLGNVTVGYSNGSVQISGSGGGGGLALANSQTTYSTGTASLLEGSGAITIGSGTGQRFNISVPQASSISATGAVSVSVNGNTISIGAPSQSMQTQGVQTINLGGNTSGAMASISSGALSLFGGNNITLSQNANSVTISGGAGGGGGGVALSAPGGSISSGTANISAGGALTASVNGQTLSLNAPATSMLSAGDGISISTVGSTVVFQAATGGGGGSGGGAGAIARWEYPTQAFNSIGVMVSNSLSMQHIPIPFNVTGTAARLAISLNLASLSNTGTTGSVAATLNVGLYTRSGSTLNSLASGSAATSFSYSSGNYVTSIYHGIRELTAPLAASITPGDYWIGAIVRTAATSGTVAMNVMGLGTAAGMHNSGSIGVMGSAIGALARDVFMGNGMYATSAIPSSVPFTGINNTAVSNLARANFYHAIYSATF